MGILAARSHATRTHCQQQQQQHTAANEIQLLQWLPDPLDDIVKPPKTRPRLVLLDIMLDLPTEASITRIDEAGPGPSWTADSAQLHTWSTMVVAS